MSPRLRRALGLIAVPALALTSLAALHVGPGARRRARPGPGRGRRRLAGRPGHRGPGPQQPVRLRRLRALDRRGAGLDAAGGHGRHRRRTSPTRSPRNLDFYVGYDYFPAPTRARPGTCSPARSPRRWCFAQAAGRDGTAYGGHNLVAELEDQVVDTGAGHRPDPGHLQPDRAVRGRLLQHVRPDRSRSAGLDAAGSPDGRGGHRVPARPAVRRGLLPAGLRGDRRRRPGLRRRPGSRSPSTDVTALAVLALLPQADDTDVAGRRSTQRPTGCSTSRQPTGRSAPARTSRRPTPTAPVWPAGRSARPARRRGRGAERPDGCAAARSTSRHRAGTALSDDQGAIAYDTAALAAGRRTASPSGCRTSGDVPRPRRCPVLQWAPDDGQRTDHADRHQRVPPGRHQGHARRPTGSRPATRSASGCGSRTVALGAAGTQRPGRSSG